METVSSHGNRGYLSHNLRRLNLNFSHQRFILWSFIIFVWSLSYLIQYASILNNEITTNITEATTKWYLSYFAIILSASCLSMLSGGRRSPFVAFLYGSTTVIAIIALYLCIKDICDDEWCSLSLFGSYSLSILLPFIIFIDIIFNMDNPTKRILLHISSLLITSLSYTIYLTNNDIKSYSSLQTIGVIGWYMLSISSFSIIVFIIFHAPFSSKIMKIINVYFISQIGLVIGACFTFFASFSLMLTSTTSNIHQDWILLLSLSIIIGYELECFLNGTVKNNKRISSPSLSQPLLAYDDMDNFETLREVDNEDDNALSSAKSQINSFIIKDYMDRMYREGSSFSLSTKAQRLVIYNLIMFIFCIVWLPQYVQNLAEDDNLSSDDEIRLKLQISGISMMLCASIMGIERKWFGYELEVGAINILFLAGIVLQWYGISYFMKECDGDQQCRNYYAGRYLFEMFFVLIIMMDTGLDQLYDDVDKRVGLNSLCLALKTLIVYISFGYGVDGEDIKSYQQVEKVGFLLLSIQFLLVFVYRGCQCLKGFIKFVMSSITLIGIGMTWNYYDWEYEFLLVLPFCCLLAFDMLQL